MPRTSLAEPAFEYDPSDPAGFRAGMVRPGPGLGALQTGASLYRLPPGQAVCPYHYEWAEEEWALVLQGRPTLRTPEGSEALAPLDLAFFPRGPAGAHLLRNDTQDEVRILMWSTVVQPAVTVYPDSDKVGVFVGDKAENLLVRRSSGVGYYDGEV